MIAWGRAADIKTMVAHVPDKWLVRFACSDAHRNDIRKFGTARNATMLYRSSAVLEAVENGETFPDPEENKESVAEAV